MNVVAQRACKRCRHPMSRLAEIAPFGGGPGLVAFMCTDCGTTDSEPQRKPLRWSVDDPRRSATQGSRVVFQRPAGAALRQLIGTHVLSSLWNFELHPEKKVYGDWLPKGHQLNYRSTTKLHNVLDGLAVDLEKGYRPGPPATSSSKTRITSRPVYQACVSRFVRPSIVTGPSLNW